MYVKRKDLINSISYLLESFPVVALLGARQVGKSTLLKKIFPNSTILDLEKAADFDRVQRDPELLFKELNAPYIIDEAQRCPELFKAMRVEVDKKRSTNGRFLISGSSSPELLKNINETLAGRVATLEISPFEWSECQQIDQSNFYTSLEDLNKLDKIGPQSNHRFILDVCLHGGYPDPFLKREDKTYFDLWFQNYIKSYVEQDIRELFPSLNLDAYRRFIQMMATSTGEIINASNFARSLDVTQPTIKKYMEIMEGTFIWRKLLPFEGSAKKRVVKMPRGHLRDSGLASYLLNIHTENELKGHYLFGRIWEGFIIEQILKGLERNLIKHSAYFYRTNNQSEIDLIIEGRFGIIPIEIKSGSSTSSSQLRTLSNFIKELDCPYGIVINNGTEIFLLKENIIQIPAIYL